MPFEIPSSWEWCRVGDLFSNMSGLAYKKDALAIKADKMIRVLRGGNIGEEQFLFKGDDVVSEYLLYAFAAKHHRDNCRNITVYNKDDIRVTFHNGLEIRV